MQRYCFGFPDGRRDSAYSCTVVGENHSPIAVVLCSKHGRTRTTVKSITVELQATLSRGETVMQRATKSTPNYTPSPETPRETTGPHLTLQLHTRNGALPCTKFKDEGNRKNGKQNFAKRRAEADSFHNRELIEHRRFLMAGSCSGELPNATLCIILGQGATDTSGSHAWEPLHVQIFVCISSTQRGGGRKTGSP